MLNGRKINNEFDSFKNKINNTDITIDIDENEVETISIHIYYKKTNLCMYFDYISTENTFIVHQVKHCGTNIPQLLTFIKELLDKYNSTYSLMDVSYFYFQNNQTREMTFIRLKELYSLCYGKTFYTRILSDDPPSKEPTVDVKILHRIPLFFYEEKHVVEIILENNANITNIGEFFRFVKDDLKHITASVNDEYKLVDEKNWETIKSYSGIITKTYTYLQEYLQNPLMQVESFSLVSPLYPMTNTEIFIHKQTQRKGKLSSTSKRSEIANTPPTRTRKRRTRK